MVMAVIKVMCMYLILCRMRDFVYILLGHKLYTVDHDIHFFAEKKKSPFKRHEFVVYCSNIMHENVQIN